MISPRQITVAQTGFAMPPRRFQLALSRLGSVLGETLARTSFRGRRVRPLYSPNVRFLTVTIRSGSGVARDMQYYSSPEAALAGYHRISDQVAALAARNPDDQPSLDIHYRRPDPRFSHVVWVSADIAELGFDAK